MRIEEWKKLRKEILKLKPIERIKKLQEVIKKEKNPIVLDDIIELLKRTAVELDVVQHQQGGTYFQPSRLERIERGEGPRHEIEERVEQVIFRREAPQEEPIAKQEDEKSGYEMRGYMSEDYLSKDKVDLYDTKLDPGFTPSEDFLSEEGEDSTRQYKRSKKKESEY